MPISPYIATILNAFHAINHQYQQDNLWTKIRDVERYKDSVGGLLVQARSLLTRRLS